MRGTGGGALSPPRGADKSGRRRAGESSRGRKSSRITSMVTASRIERSSKDDLYRIEILQKIRQDELDRKKVEERRRLERGLRDSVPRVKREEAAEQVMIVMVIMMSEVMLSVFLKSEREKSRTRVLFGSGVSVARLHVTDNTETDGRSICI